ncbi:MAG: CDP-glucose 4,6-dehydratase [Pseudomonadota bacterium]
MTAECGQSRRTRLPDRNFWSGRRVLLTGHTGFKGSWLAVWLHDLGARVTGLSLSPDTEPSLYRLAELDDRVASHIGDIRDPKCVADVVAAAEPEVVLHLAAQALVRRSYEDPLETFSTNVHGTGILLDALRPVESLTATVVVTSDKVYRNREWIHPYRETDELGGHDPYSASKAAAEHVADSFRLSFFGPANRGLATARAGNVIGGGDWAPERLIPDAVRAWQSGESLQVRRPGATRPWQHVLEPLCGYLVLAETIAADPALAGAFNLGPAPDTDTSVRSVIEMASRWWAGPDRPEAEAAPVDWARSESGPHEANRLSLDPTKAARSLGVRPVWSVQTAVERSFAWYRKQAEGESALVLCRNDIAAFVETASQPDAQVVS